MEVSYLLRGIAIGFAIAAPVGPIGILCIRRTLARGPAFGLVSGLGAATADAIYGCIAGFGLTFVSRLLIDQQSWLRLIGGVFLCYLGVRIFLDKPAEHAATTGRYSGLLGAYASTLFLTLTNPVTIVAFAAVFAGVGIGSTTSNYASAVALVLGVFTGSSSWWLLLSTVTSFIRTRLGSKVLIVFHRLSGVMVIGMGLIALVQFAASVHRNR